MAFRQDNPEQREWEEWVWEHLPDIQAAELPETIVATRDCWWDFLEQVAWTTIQTPRRTHSGALLAREKSHYPSDSTTRWFEWC